MSVVVVKTEISYTDGSIKKNHGNFRVSVVNDVAPFFEDSLLTLLPGVSKRIESSDTSKLWNIFCRSGAISVEVISNSGAMVLDGLKQLTVTADITSVTIRNTSSTNKASVRVLVT